MDTADRTQSEVAEAKTNRLKDKIAKLKQQMHDLKVMEQRLHRAPDGQVSLTDPDARSMAPVAAAPVWWATTCKAPLTTSIT